MCLRVYAVTGKNKLLCGVLSVLAATQLGLGICLAVVNGTASCEFLSHLFVRVLFHRSLVQPLPNINLDIFKVCLPRRWPPGEIAFTTIPVAFGTPLPFDFQHNSISGVLTYSTFRTPLRCGTVDVFAFLMIVVAVRGRTAGFPGIPNLFGAILRDATIYFLLIFALQFVLLMFAFFAPVGDPDYIRGLLTLYSSLVHVQTQIRVLPGR